MLTGKAEVRALFRSPYLRERGQHKRELMSVLRLNMNSEGTPKLGENVASEKENCLQCMRERPTFHCMLVCVYNVHVIAIF